MLFTENYQLFLLFSNFIPIVIYPNQILVAVEFHVALNLVQVLNYL